MDGLFEIYVPKNNTNIFKISQYELDGIKYLQGDPKFVFNENLEMVMIQRPNYINNFLPESHRRDDWSRIEVLGIDVDEYFSSSEEERRDYYNGTFKKCIADFLQNVDQYVLVWLAEGDSFNALLQIDNTDDFFAALDKNSEFVMDGICAFK